MAYITPDTAVTGNIITAADGNRRRDNDEYFKGRAGTVSVEAGVAVTGAITASSTITAASSVVSNGSGSGYNFLDRLDASKLYVVYANAGQGHLYSAGYGNVLSWNYAGGGIVWPDLIDNGIWPGRLKQEALAGFLRAGTWTYAYNGDGTIASQLMNAAGPLNGYAITYEYTSSRISAMRLRAGGTGGSIIASVSYSYDGSGRVSTETHS